MIGRRQGALRLAGCPLGAAPTRGGPRLRPLLLRPYSPRTPQLQALQALQAGKFADLDQCPLARSSFFWLACSQHSDLRHNHKRFFPSFFPHQHMPALAHTHARNDSYTQSIAFSVNYRGSKNTRGKEA